MAVPAGFRLSPQQELLLAGASGVPAQCAVDVGEADPVQLRDALVSLTRRYEILRTAFVRSTGMRLPSQIILDEVEPDWGVDDRPAEEVIAEEAARGFEPEAAPLLRARLSQGTTLVLTAHPAVADGPALLELIRAMVAGAAEGDEPLQYADYAEWRAELAADGESRSDAETTASPTLLFGRVAPRDEAATTRTLELGVPAGLPAALAAAAAECNVSRPLFVEASWRACIHRLSGATEVTAASVTNGRHHGELEGAIGAFAQLVEVTTRLEPETTVAEIVDQVRRRRESGVAGQDALTGAALERSAHNATLSFQSFDAPFAADALHTLRAPAAPVALQLAWIETSDEPRAQLLYDNAAYDAADVQVIAGAFVTLLTAAASQTSGRVEVLPLVSAEDRAGVVASLRGPALDVPRRAYHELFEEQVMRTPERPALRDAAGSLTYAEVDVRANALAKQLRALGVGRNDAVGMCTHRSSESLVAVLGILKAGGAYVPLNFEHPPARLQHQLTETAARVVVAEPDLVQNVPAFDGETVVLDAEATDAASPERVNDPDDLVYVMYTSGSTGLPKGVRVTHANLVNYSLAVADRLGVDTDEALNYAVVSAISTDLGNTAIFPALLTGGCVNLVAPDSAMDPQAFAAVAEEWGIDVLKITPSHLGALLAGTDSPAVLPRRLLVVGGEALSWQLVDDVSLRAPALRIVNHYGPTETTVGICTLEVGSDSDRHRPRTVPIGRPLANARAYVVDASGEVVPAGVPGELLLGGAGVAGGYVGRAEETAARFVPDAYGDGSVYRTGDRARALPDGTIEFLGRVDDQLKIRGYRVEPGEIEAALARHPAVKQAAVRAVADAAGNARLVAYHVTGSRVTGDELHSFLAESLPDYMIPATFVSLDALPLTASGKIDRLALPDPETTADRSADYVAPRNDVEAEIARIWGELLGVERVGVFDDFFELGGHSLLATQVIMRVRRVYGDVPLQAMFMAPTPAGLAEVIQASAAPAEAAS